MSVSALSKKDKIAVFPSSEFIRIYIFSVFGNLRIPTRDKCETELFNKSGAPNEDIVQNHLT